MDALLVDALAVALVSVAAFAFTYAALELRGLLTDANERLTAAINDVLESIGVDAP